MKKILYLLTFVILSFSVSALIVVNQGEEFELTEPEKEYNTAIVQGTSVDVMFRKIVDGPEGNPIEAEIVLYDKETTGRVSYSSARKGNVKMAHGLALHVVDIKENSVVLIAEETECYDTDGKDPYTKGTTTGKKSADGQTITRTDACYSDGVSVYERTCSEGLMKVGKYECEKGEKCKDGACIKTEEKCTDTDGKNLYTKGTTTGRISANSQTMTETDTCYSDGISVQEYTCSEGLMKVGKYECEKGEKCKDGACIKTEEKCTDTDGGENLRTKGTAKGRDEYGRTTEITDKCKADYVINEAICASEFALYKERWCPRGYVCQDGACLSAEEREYNIKINVREGWNLIAADDPFFDYSSSLPKVSAAFLYLPLTKEYVDNAGGYTESERAKYVKNDDYLTLGAQWVYFDEPGTVTLTAEKDIPDDIRGVPYIRLYKGWNLVAIPPQFNDRSLTWGDCTVEKAYIWDSFDQNWDKVRAANVGEYLIEGSDDLIGYGVAVKVSDTCGMSKEVSGIASPPPIPQ